MYCPNCGKENDNKSKFCIECGHKLKGNNSVKENSQPITIENNNNNNDNNNNDSGSWGWFILGFFFHLVGFILYLIWLNKSPKNAKKAGLGSLIGFIVYIVFIFAIGYFISYFIISNVKTHNENSVCSSYCSEYTYDEDEETCYCNNGEKYYVGEVEPDFDDDWFDENDEFDDVNF